MRRRLKSVLAGLLPPSELAQLYNSYDIVGDIAIIRLANPLKKHGETIAKAILNIHRNVRTVLAQTEPVAGDFRLRKLEYLFGVEKTTTFHREWGCIFHVDVKNCYFSPRLLHERMRIAKQVREGETVVNMFAGVGCFSIIIARNSGAAKIYSIDVNPTAIRYMKENIRLNRVYSKVLPVFGDAKEIVTRSLTHVADRVLMPLPEKALDYLPYALFSLKESGGWIHYQDFEHATKTENAVEKVKAKVVSKLEDLNVNFEIAFERVIRTTGPNWCQVALDIEISG